MRSSARRLLVALLAVASAACGARSELPEPGADCTPLQVGLLGNPGAYSTHDFDAWLVESGATAARLQTTAAEPLTEATLQPFDVVVLDWLARDYTAAEAAVLASWISAGGGLIAMTGYDNDTTDDWHANSLLAPLGVAYAGPLLSGPVTAFAPHPITDGLGSVVFEGGYGISDLGGPAATRTPIASLSTDAGEVEVGYAVEAGRGRAFVWGDEWVEFLNKGDLFPPRFWVQAFRWVSPAARCTLAPPE